MIFIVFSRLLEIYASVKVIKKYSFSGKLIQRSTLSSSSSRTTSQNTDSTIDDFLEDKGNNSVCNLN